MCCKQRFHVYAKELRPEGRADNDGIDRPPPAPRRKPGHHIPRSGLVQSLLRSSRNGHHDDLGIAITMPRNPHRDTKFHKSRLVPLHETAQAGLELYLRHRRPYAPLDDHVFVSLRRKPLRLADVESASHTAVKQAGLPPGAPRARPTPYPLRHSFAVRALQTCPDGRDAIGKHMLALSTYLGHSRVAHTYWYLEAVPDLMRDIAERTEDFVTGGQL